MAPKTPVTELARKLSFLEGHGYVGGVQETRLGKDVAGLIGVSAQSYSGYKGDNDLPLDRQRELARVFQFDADSKAWLEGSAADFKQEYLAHHSQLRSSPDPSEESATGVPADISELPTTRGPLFGRQAEIELLNNAWAGSTTGTRKSQEYLKTNIFLLVAVGGAGKTAVVNRWLQMMSSQNWAGATRVFGWSFYKPGNAEDRASVASADRFFERAFEWFGSNGTQFLSAWDRGLKLAQLIQKERVLLVLDGLEPLQYPPGPMDGRLKDRGIEALLKQLAVQNAGLCLVTSRYKLSDLETSFKSVISKKLENVSVRDGILILRQHGVWSANKAREDYEFQEAVKDFGCHALALTLLGSFLKAAFGGDIINRSRISKLVGRRTIEGQHAERVMASYESWLAENNKLDLTVLYLLGLFERPASKEMLRAVSEGSPISGLTGDLPPASEAEFNLAITRLCDLDLVSAKDLRFDGDVDAHPLVRDFFGSRLKELNLSAWREAHLRLYSFYKDKIAQRGEKAEAKSLSDMGIYFSAIYHACSAGLYRETFHGEYRKHVHKERSYLARVLGYPGQDLTILSYFFIDPWQQVADELEPYSKAVIRNYVADRLRAVGRTSDAISPIKMALQEMINIRQRRAGDDPFGMWGNRDDEVVERNIGIGANLLSECYALLGKLGEASQLWPPILELGSGYDNPYFHAVSNVGRGNVEHYLGNFASSVEFFENGESFNLKVPRKKDSQPLILYSLQGFQYCELLLDLGCPDDVLGRCNAILPFAEEQSIIREIALADLSVARALFQKNGLHQDNRWGDALNRASKAVEGFRKAETLHFLPRALLARASLLIEACSYDAAVKDLSECFDIAHRGSMMIFGAECHLASAILGLKHEPSLLDVPFFDEVGKVQRATLEQHVGLARCFIDSMGYGRRRLLVDRLENITATRGSKSPKHDNWFEGFEVNGLLGRQVARH